MVSGSNEMKDQQIKIVKANKEKLMKYKYTAKDSPLGVRGRAGIRNKRLNMK